MSKNLNVKVGEVINFTSGEYSDYNNIGLVKFKKDCDLREVILEYKKVTNPENEPYSDDIPGLVTELVKLGYCEVIDNREIWLGSYSEFNI